jgi:hypothetical protein
VISLFSDADLVENARAMGLLDKKPETPPETPPPAAPEDQPDAKGKKKKGG